LSPALSAGERRKRDHGSSLRRPRPDDEIVPQAIDLLRLRAAVVSAHAFPRASTRTRRSEEEGPSPAPDRRPVPRQAGSHRARGAMSSARCRAGARRSPVARTGPRIGAGPPPSCCGSTVMATKRTAGRGGKPSCSRTISAIISGHSPAQVVEDGIPRPTAGPADRHAPTSAPDAAVR
jgi:hypothetical protein